MVKIFSALCSLLTLGVLVGCGANSESDDGGMDNRKPVAIAQSISLNEDSSQSIILAGSDEDGDLLNYHIVDLPIHGTLAGTAPDLIYTPSADYNGDDSFTFQVNDGSVDSAVATISITIFSVIDPILPLNDTGITYGGNFPENNNGDCIGETISEQDCSSGRDVTNNDESDGHAGFSFAKLDANGADLPDTATNWSCIRDNVTGLTWEAKQADGLHRNSDTFSWYSTDVSTNGGREGDVASGDLTCFGFEDFNANTYCNTEAFVERVNASVLCGFNDWRVPSKSVLGSIVNYDNNTTMIETNYFPRTQISVFGASVYWTSTPDASTSDYVWIVDFRDGESIPSWLGNKYGVRLVRGGPL